MDRRSYTSVTLLWIYCFFIVVEQAHAAVRWSPRMMLSPNSTEEERNMYDCNVEKWMECNSCMSCEERKNKCRQLRSMSASCINITTDSSGERGRFARSPFSPNCLESDEMLVDNQIEPLKDQLSNTCGSRRRVKRKIRRFADFPITKWGSKIYYKLDGTLRDHEARMIRDAIAMWTKDTCLEFVQIGVERKTTQNHLIFSKVRGWGCYSYIGKATVIPQPIYLSFTCFSSIGYIAHEIGHSLGLFHEHQRIDRDNFIQIRKSNIGDGAEGNFAMVLAKFIEDKNVPYDMASAMHYRAMAFSSNGKNTIVTSNPLFQRTIGQRVELSFSDLKIINLAYCAHKCKYSPLPRPCENRGYQDHDDCTKCKCPDGLTGRYCEQTKSNGMCGGDLTAPLDSSASPGLITSPGYNRGYYNVGTECSWKIKARRGYRLKIKFTDDFGVYCFSNRCRHWVEIRYEGDLGTTGPRFCCSETPTEEILSEGDDVLVIFKSLAETNIKSNRRGFKIQYSQVKKPCPTNPCRNGAFCWQSSKNTQICECPARYYGPYCDNYGRPEEPTTRVPPTRVPRPRPPRPSSDRADILVLLDRSIHPYKPWNDYTRFLRAMLAHVRFDSDTDRVGVVSYAMYANTTVQLGTINNPDAIVDVVKGVNLQPRQANPYKPLWHIQHEVLLDTYRNRQDVPDVAVIITDSNFPDDFPQGIIVQGAMQAREAGIHIIAVGVGNQVSRRTLDVLSGKPENSFKLSYRQLYSSNIAEAIMDRVKDLARSGPNGRGNKGSSGRARTPRPATTTTSTTSTSTEPTTTTTTTTKRTTTTPKPTSTTTTTTSTTTTTTATTTSKPTTTTTDATTTTTKATTTTTTTATTTTEQQEQESEGRSGGQQGSRGRYPGSETCWWEKDGDCSQPCGGCGVQTWRYICKRPNGAVHELAVRDEPCNDKKCQGWCLMYIARVYYMPCGPECCGNYKPLGNKCVSGLIEI